MCDIITLLLDFGPKEQFFVDYADAANMIHDELLRRRTSFTFPLPSLAHARSRACAADVARDQFEFQYGTCRREAVEFLDHGVGFPGTTVMRRGFVEPESIIDGASNLSPGVW